MKRDDLVRALEVVKPGLANKEIGNIEQTTAFAFLDGRVVTYNDEISIAAPIEGLEVEGAIKAEELYKFLKKLTRETIEIESTETEVVLKCGRAKAGFLLQHEIKLPLEEVKKKSDWQTLPENFKEALAFTMTTCARDLSRPVLTCINVRSDGVLESSDDYRISRYKLNDSMLAETFLLPATAAHVISNYPIVSIAEGENWVHFATEDGIEFSCRVFEENFPEVGDIIDSAKGSTIELPEKMGEVVDRAAIFCTQESILDQKMIVSISGRRLKLRAESETSWFEEQLNVSHEGEDITISINPHLLRMILSQTRQCILSERCLKFAGENWEHVVALIA